MSDYKELIKNYGRIALAILLVTASLVAIFGVGGIAASDTTVSNQADDGVTNLRFGLQLEGGTRIQAPLYGVTAEDTSVSPQGDNIPQLERNISNHLSGVSPTDVNIRTVQESSNITGQQTQPETTTHIEVTSENVSQSDLANALEEEGIEYASIRDGVTAQTRDRLVTVINNKINQAGLSGGTARTVRTANGNYHILIEVPGESREDVIQVLQDRGSVRVDIYYPVQQNGTTEYQTRKAVLEQGDFQQIGNAQQSPQYGPHLPVTLTQSAAQDFRTATQETGMVPSGSSCAYDSAPNETGPCLLTKVDGQVVYSAGMSPSLATSIDSGEWVNNPSFILQTKNMSEAQELALHLQAGELPTSIAFENGSVITVTPTQGEEFKMGSFLIGLVALFAVALKVFTRYRDPKIVIPMVLVSISEVTILAGFAAVIGYPIDLSVVGGFIAVIGTGIDDLIIVANEILQKGDINSNRVFRSRFKKAFWVIGAAALTTIVALSPLIAFGLGQLAGFAIFTIVGILAGVFITRPAYGDYLNHILIDDKH